MRAPKKPLNIDQPRAIESIEGLTWDSKLIILDDADVRHLGAYTHLPRGKVIRVDLFGGLREVEKLIENHRVRFAKVEDAQPLAGVE